jgi:hypothetical protein
MKRKQAAAYRVRVADAYVHGFRYFRESVQLPAIGRRIDATLVMPAQVVLAPSATALLGRCTDVAELARGGVGSWTIADGGPFEWSDEIAARWVAGVIGGEVELAKGGEV